MRKKTTSGTATVSGNSVVGCPDDLSLEEPQRDTAAEFSGFDFHSQEFNVMDELDDNRGNYRAFHSLEGIETSDMRHHRERKRLERSIPDIAEEDTATVEEKFFVDEGITIKDPQSLTVISKGRLLIVDADCERALNCAERLGRQGITSTLCVPTRGSSGLSVSQIDSFAFVETDAVAIAGCFGGFTAAVTGSEGKPADLSALIGHLSSATGQGSDGFDLILDLQSTPSFVGQQLPVGYYAPGEDVLQLEKTLAELPEMRGRFKRPQFTLLLENRCIHERSHHYSCLRCMQICPVIAIKSDDRGLIIDQYRCQGCGACALVCPADAIKQLDPPPEELLIKLSELLSESRAGNYAAPDVIFYDKGIDESKSGNRGDTDSDRMIFLEVEDIGHIGLEVLLVALAYGAGSVTLVCDRMRPAGIRNALKQQVLLGKDILHGLGMSAEHLCFTDTFTGKIQPGMYSATQGSAGQNIKSVNSPATFSFTNDKRTLIRLAAEYLCRLSHDSPAVVPLATGLPFGTIAIDESCSLCMACVSACPSSAIEAGGDQPRLSFLESRCHQCGFCAAACPENAIQLTPRLLCDTKAADAPTVLREVAPFRCIECGEPFASVAMINRMQTKLEGHWMYSSNQQVSRLKMCRTCRTRDALTAGDYHS